MKTASPVILPTAYHPSIFYFVLLHHQPRVVIDIYEHYYKQTYRNRAIIYGPGGKQTLSIPIISGRSLRMPVHDVQISYTEHWQHQHLRAIDTAYHSAPFFEIVFPDIEYIIQKQHRYLWELNKELLEYYLSLLHLDVSIVYSTEYIENQDDAFVDFRKIYSPKTNYAAKYDFLNKPYYQVFAIDKSFIPELSILDLVMHLGHEAGYYIRTII